MSIPNALIIDPLIIWGLLPRILGLAYLVALGSMIPQVLPLSGSGGIVPIEPRLGKIAQDYPGARRFFYFPTLLWFSPRDAMVLALPLVGCISAGVAIYGGAYGWAALLVCWICLLSLDPIVNLVYPWDSFLLEAGFLALLLPAIHELPLLRASAAPLPLVAMGFRLLVIRLMWGFAKLKFTGTERGDRLYLGGFFANQPIPNPVGWLLSRSPAPFLVAALTFMFFAEVICPGLLFFTGWPRLIGVAGLVMLMLGIQLTGNFGYFNLAYIGVCVCLLDVGSSNLDVFDGPLLGLVTPWDHAVRNAVMLVLLFGALIYFPFNSWCTQTWLHWNWDRLLHLAPPLRPMFWFYRALAPFRVVNSYGVFPPHSSPPVKMIPVIEGSDDSKTWRAYHYRFMPTDEHSPPRFIAPHHPRIDHAVFYAAVGLNDSNFQASGIGAGNPYGFHHYSVLDRLVQCILRGEKLPLRLFKNDPFPDTPPSQVRISLYAITPTTLAQRKTNGDWWQRSYVGPHRPATGLNPDVSTLPDPELFHWDNYYWKRRAPALRKLSAAAHKGLDEALLVGPGDVTSQDIALFWDEFMPFVSEPQRRANWQRLGDTIDAVRGRYDSAQVRRFERIMARTAWLLSDALYDHWLGAAEPKLDLDAYFDLGLLIHEIILDGRAAVESILASPANAADVQTRMTQASSFYLWGLFRYDTVLFLTRKIRIVRRLTTDHTLPVPGFPQLVPFLAEQLHDAEQERLPDCERDDEGRWRVTMLSE